MAEIEENRRKKILNTVSIYSSVVNCNISESLSSDDSELSEKSPKMSKYMQLML